MEAVALEAVTVYGEWVGDVLLAYNAYADC